MQPQDPTPPNQQPNTGGIPPTPPPAAPGGTPGAWPASSQPPKSGGNKKVLMIVGIVVGVVLIAGAIFGGMKLFGDKLELETFSNDDFSVLVPVGYEKEEGAVIAFKEPGEEATQSAVLAQYQALPQTLEESQLAEVRDAFKEQIEQSADDFVTGDEELENLQVVDTTFKGEEGIEITGTITKNGEKVGDLKMVAVINTEAIYLVGVGVHVSDKDLAKEVDNIINSFELK